MRVIIAGSRNLKFLHTVTAVKESGWLDVMTEVVCGKAKGPDTHGEQIARLFNIPVKPFPADWNRYGKRQAGLIRNTEMAAYADALIAVWDGESHGTQHMIKEAERFGLQTFIYRVRIENHA